jgi:hypothetical protein
MISWVHHGRDAVAFALGETVTATIDYGGDLDLVSI